MHRFWDSVYKHDSFYRFKIDKRKRFKLTLEIFRDIFKICLIVQGQDFDVLLTDEEIMSFLRELRHTREINSLNDVVVDHMHQPWRTFAALINKSLSGMKTEPMKKSKRVKRYAKKSTKAPSGGVVIRETIKMPVFKKKEKTNPSSSGTVTKTTPSATKIKPSVTNEETGVKPGVLNVTEEESSKSETESWGNDEDDSNNEHDSRSKGSGEENDSDDKNIQSDSEKESDSKHETNENELDSESDHEENEEEEEEFLRTPFNDFDDDIKIFDKDERDEDEDIYYTTSQLYDDVDIRLNEPVDADEAFI
nr:hypothetical protein [Tanacetum cinerariifolium]